MIIDKQIIFTLVLTTFAVGITVMAALTCIICPIIAHKFSLENPEDAYCNAALITVTIIWVGFFITILLMRYIS